MLLGFLGTFSLRVSNFSSDRACGMTDGFWGVPDYDCSIIYPQTLSQLLRPIIKSLVIVILYRYP